MQARLMNAIAELLLEDDQGRPYFPQSAEPLISAVVEVAARIPDEARRRTHLLDLVKMAIALSKRSPEAAAVIERAILSCPLAKAALGRHLERNRRRGARLARFEGRVEKKRAPHPDAPTVPGAVKLSTLGQRYGLARELGPTKKR